jgi:hypothetical protein
MTPDKKNESDVRYIQVASSNKEESLEKTIHIPAENKLTKHGLIKTNTTESGIEGEQEGKDHTAWHFAETCTPWRKNIAPTTKISPHLTSINSLRFEGFYNYQSRYWERYYVTTGGIVISLLEDIPETGGQNCLWGAGLVMARCVFFLNCD